MSRQDRPIHETSPYLLQHANNLVDWYPWGDEALDGAKTEDKPILLSIGYSSCHWCHVMAHESFEDEATAQFMNDRFVNVKVDREEQVPPAYRGAGKNRIMMAPGRDLPADGVPIDRKGTSS